MNNIGSSFMHNPSKPTGMSFLSYNTIYSYCVSRVCQRADPDDEDLSMFVRMLPGHRSVHVKISDDHGSCQAPKTRPGTLQIQVIIGLMHTLTDLVSKILHTK